MAGDDEPDFILVMPVLAIELRQQCVESGRCRTDVDYIGSITVDTELMALLFKLTPDKRLEAAMSGPMRDVIVAEVFRRMPERLDHRAAAGLEAAIAWRIRRPDGAYDRYLVRVADGACSVEPGGEGEARVSLQMDSLTFCKVVTGNANPVMQFMTGKLSVRGDLMFAANVTRLFDIPSPA